MALPQAKLEGQWGGQPADVNATAAPTKEMAACAASAGLYDLGEHGCYAKIQIITVEDYFL